MEILEKFSSSKSGNIYDNEDVIFTNDNFVLLLDGATSKQKQTVNNQTSGQFAVKLIKQAMLKINLLRSPVEILEDISHKLNEKAQSQGFFQMPSATIIFYNALRGEIVRYGDCSFMVNGKLYKGFKELDNILSEKRSKFLQSELLKGKSVNELQQNDTGRQFILQDLIESSQYANRLCKYGFPVLNGGKIIKEYIDVVKVEKNDVVVFASDGYPIVKESLAETEKELKSILAEDPLCMNLYKSTKGVAQNQVSFDDRSYIKFIV